MRNGKLLVEDSPNTIITHYNRDTLDECFLLLSLQQEEIMVANENVNNNLTLTSTEYLEEIIIKPYTAKEYRSMILTFTAHMKALLTKNILNFIRQPPYVFIN